MWQAFNNQQSRLSVPEILYPQIQPAGVQKYLGKKFQKVPPKKAKFEFAMQQLCTQHLHYIGLPWQLRCGKKSTCNAGDPVQSLGWEDPLENGMATHSSIQGIISNLEMI